MSDPAFNAADVALAIARGLESSAVPYALGGALAYGVWALPRATKDVDINLFVTPEQLPAAMDALSKSGVVFDQAEAVRQAEEEGLFIGWIGACRIDLFTPSIPFSWEALKTRVRIDVKDTSVWFLSAEALSFFKMMFFRGKDLVDLERLISNQGPHLDAPYVRRWLVETMGEEDERVRKWDELCATFWRAAP